MNAPPPSSPFPTPPPLALHAAAAPRRGAPLRPSLIFRWRQDRYGHAIELDQRRVAESVDGSSVDVWPPSAPVQQLSLETLHGRSTLLGVGAAGRSHWSVSVEAVDLDGVPAFLFEWACRVKRPPGRAEPASSGAEVQVGSEYRVDEGVTIIPLEGTLREQLGPDRLRLFPESPPASPQSGSTLQWRYRIELAPC